MTDILFVHVKKGVYNMAKAEDVIRIAVAEIGYHEKATNAQLDDKTANSGSANFTKYARDLDAIGDFYNGRKQGSPGCDLFNDWVHWIANGRDLDKTLRELCQPKKSAGAGCRYSYRYYKLAGRAGKTPKLGAQIFYGASESTISHTGIVEKFDDQYVYTIEGNVSNSVKRVKTARNSPKIYGYGYPLYDEEPIGNGFVPSNANTSYHPSNKEIPMGKLDALNTTVQSLGIVDKCDSLNVRSLPGSEHPQIKTVPVIARNTVVEILDKVPATAKGNPWYYVRINGKSHGFVSSSYITLVDQVTDTSNNADYVNGNTNYSTR